MTFTEIVMWLVVIFVFSVLVTGYLKRYSLKNALVDIPNERSSHTTPTPRGGGLSITLSIIICIGLLYYLNLIAANVTLALSGGILVAVTGWLDDHDHIPAFWRALSYTIAAIWAVYWLQGLDIITLGTYVVSLPVSGSLGAVLALVWLTNLYNFMDGTDALAATETISAGIFAGVLYLLSGQTGLALLCFSIASSSAGFLYWNWPPARIFMGDAGSCYIGFVFGVLALTGEKTGTMPIIIWIILLSVFVFDATYTLLMRIIRREKWYEAHRSHAYQRLVTMNMSHSRLAMLVLGVNIGIIWPAAYIAYRHSEYSFISLLMVILFMSIAWAGIQGYYNQHITAKN